MSTTIALPKLGTLFAAQGGIFAGVMPVQAEGPEYGLIVCTDPAGTFVDTPWGDPRKALRGCASDDDGLANTLAMAEAGNDLARCVLALDINGFTDWYIPARNELRLAYVTARAHFEPRWYWSSTQYSAGYAWGQYFGDGDQYLYGKAYEGRVRAVRRFLIP